MNHHKSMWFLRSLSLVSLASMTQSWMMGNPSVASFGRVQNTNYVSTRPSVRQQPHPIYSTAEPKERDLAADEDDSMDDETLLKTVPKAQFQDLCQQLNLSTKGTKQELLLRLRQHAADQIEKEKERRELYEQRVEEGFGDDSKERYEIVSESNSLWDDEDADDEDDYFIFFNDPNITATSQNETALTSNSAKETKFKAPKPAYLTQAAVTAPPIPPDLKPNADGERVVTTYSTADENDLTSMTASTQSSTLDSLQNIGDAAAPSEEQPWDAEAANQKSKTSNAQIEQATEKVTELVQQLLAMSGAPAFREMAEESDMEMDVDIPQEFVGFDPAQVPMNTLKSASKSLRTGRGQVLSEVLRQFELQAIGQDGIAGDKRDKGGGHYREVSKVRAFLEGFRRAEVRKFARETTTLLLDKLVQEGIEGLDMTLSTMTRSSDDTADFAGELNDSLLDYLNDAIRQQEKKVDSLVSQRLAAKDDDEKSIVHQIEKGPNHHFDGVNRDTSGDVVNALWNVTTEDGQRIESIDPNDPMVKRVLQDELEKESSIELKSQGPEIPDTAPEKLLLLLTLLKERIKAEAAFVADEKGRNLRLLAYCMRASDILEREQLILKDVGNSLDVSFSSSHCLFPIVELKWISQKCVMFVLRSSAPGFFH